MPMPTTTTHDLVLLSSSPPHIPDSDIISTPPHLRDPPPPAPPSAQPPPSPVLSSRSSSSLPSPTVLFKRRPALQGLKSGSRAARIPDGVALGFASAGALVRERVLNLDAEEEEETVEDGGRDKRGEGADGAAGRGKGAKRAPRKTVQGEDGAVAKKPRKSRKKEERDDVPLVVESVEENVLPEWKNERKRSGVEGAGSSKGHQDAPTTETGAAEKPKPRKTKAKLNNSELIRDVLGLDPTVEAPQSKPREGGAVERLKKRKAKNDAAQTSASPAESGASAELSRHDSALDEVLPQQPMKPPKTLEKKPRARKPKKPIDLSAEPGVIEEAAKGPKPRKRQTTARKSTKTVSKHFSPDNLVDTTASTMNVAMPVNEPAEPLDLSPAMLRRQSWTPPKDTKSSPNGHDPLKPVDLCESPEEKAPVAAGPKPSFTELLNAFGYEGQRAGSEAIASRTESGEAFTKRRRLEPIEKPNQPAEASIPETHRVPSEKPEKAPKKKPRTITDLVTAAYRPAAPAVTSEPQKSPTDPKVSAFFAPQADSTSGPDRPDVYGVAKPKRTGRSKNPTKKAESKAKKPTAKSKKATKPAAEKLLSPESALLRMGRQDILFGTSSQLVREESPTFVRDLQQALRDSEMLGSQVDSLETLHLKPAVSGSGLSLIGQRKGLWAAASRDHEDGILEQEENSLSQESETNVFVDDSMDFMPDVPEKAPSPTQAQTAATYIDASRQPETTVPATCSADDLPEAPPMPFVGDDGFERFPSAQPAQPSSDFIDIDEFDYDHQVSRPPNHSALPISHTKSRPSPNAGRTVLQQLGTRPNIPLLSQSISDVSDNQSKATFATKAASRSKKATPAAEKSPTKRPVGRPRKVAAPEEAASQDLGGETSVAQVTSPTKRPVGRPRKTAVAEASKSPSSSPERRARSPLAETSKSPLLSPKKRSRPTPKAAPSVTPKKRKKTAKPRTDEEYPDIEDIEDSQEEISPSPPRRRTKRAAADPPLALSLSQEERKTVAAFEGPTVSAPGSTKRKGTERFSLYFLEAVLPIITTVVKACRPSDNPLQPSWHEKMLLYDPIVAEDLAEWLNGQGVQIGVRVPVVESKTKRRKREGAGDDGTPIEEPPGRNEMQELPAWAVQRWCEENSVCCMFKESQWNGRGRKAKRR